MNPTIKNVLAVVTGIIIGSIVNIGLIMLSGYIIPPPDGVDATNMESLASNIHLFEPKHFIMPYLAHALGTLAGAFITAKIAATRKMKLAITIGVFFLIGGITNAYLLPAPTWFIMLDLVLAYIPMGWLGGRLVMEKVVGI